MSVTIGEVRINFPRNKIERGFVGKTKEALVEIQDKFAQKLDAKLSTKGTGKKWPNLPNRSSRPGRPPAQQSGTLRRSWRRKMKPKTQGKVVTISLRQFSLMNKGVSVKDYGAWLEEGTKKMKARPYLGPVRNAMFKKRGNMSQAARIIKRHIDVGVRDANRLTAVGRFNLR